MQAIVIDRFEDPGTLRDMPAPLLDPNSVLVRVAVAGVNPVDWKTRAGQAGERQFPLVLGQDFAGVIEALGEGVERVAVGDRVFGCARAHGSYTQATVVPDLDKTSPFTKIPDGIDDATAAALPTPALTALAALDKLEVTNGVDVLIVGAAGAVGSAATQIAHKRGANITAVVKPGQAAEVRQYGARTVVESDGDFLEAVRAVQPRPFERVLDLVGSSDELQHHLPLYAAGGTLVTTVHAADTEWFFDHDITAVNLTLYETDASSPRGLDMLADLVLAGDLKVSVAQERPLGDAVAVLDQLQAGTLHGKIVLRVGAV